MILARLRYLQAVGGWHGDAIRAHKHQVLIGGNVNVNNPFPHHAGSNSANTGYTESYGGVETHTRAFATLGCVYVRRI